MADTAFMKNFVQRPALPQPSAKPKISRKPPTVAQMPSKGAPNPVELQALMKAAAGASAIGGAMAARGKK